MIAWSVAKAEGSKKQEDNNGDRRNWSGLASMMNESQKASREREVGREREAAGCKVIPLDR